MTTLFLIRHGDNDYLRKNKMPGRIPGIHLNERGKQQAADLARTMCLLPLKAIYSSPLERAVETATPLANLQKLKIKTVPGLMDTDVGKWAGRSWKTLVRMKIWETVQKQPSRFRFPGGETFGENQTRVVAALTSIVTMHDKDDMVAVIFHSDPIKLALAHYLGMPLDNFQRLTAHTGSVTIVRIDGGTVRVLAMNLIPPFTFPKW
jgi:probable phosphomutase (TIGR03848 family)